VSKDDKQLAAARWKAVEAFLGYDSVSRLARDIGVLIVCRADLRPASKRYGRCYLSEVSIATRLGTTVRSVARAKKELKAHGLVGYQSHAGPSHTTLYTPDWHRLIDMAGETEASAKAAVDAAPKRPNRGSQHDASVMSQHDASVMFQRDASVMESSSITSYSRSSSTAAASAAVAPNGASASTASMPADHEPGNLQCQCTYCKAGYAEAEIERSRAMNGSERQARRFYPRLWEAFDADTEITAILHTMSEPEQRKASACYATKGLEAAAALIRNSRQ
jgi:hypothetical protein